MADKTIRIKGEFDASGILASFKKIRDEAAKGGIGDKMLAGYDKELEKAEKLTTQMMAQLSKGLNNAADIREFTRTINQLEKSYGVLNVKAASFADSNNYAKQNAEIRKYASQLDQLVKKQDELRKVAASQISAKGEKLKLDKEEINQLKKALNDAEAYKKLVDDITVAKAKALQQDINKAAIGSDAGQKVLANTGTGNNFEFGVAAKKGRDANRENLAKKGVIDAAAAQAAAEKEYQQVLQKTMQESKSAEDAVKEFTEVMRKYKLEVTNADEIQEQFAQDMEKIANAGLNTPWHKDGTGGIEASKKKDFTQRRDAINNMSSLVTDADVQANFQGLEQQAQTTNQLTDANNRYNDSLKTTTDSINKERISAEQAGNTEIDKRRQIIAEAQKYVSIQDSIQKGFDRIGSGAKQILSVTTSWRAFRNVIKSTFNDIKDLDKAFGSIAMVTSYSVKDMWAQYDQYAAMANKLGQSTKSVVEASALYYQQGLKTNEVMQLTEETMKLATLAGLDFKEATSQMTAALRAFHMDMSEGAHVTDVYAEVAAHAAVDVQGLSEAMSACAAIANSSGMAFETTTAMLATMTEATQEAPKNLGTAMKTILARFTELKNNVAGTADSEFDDLDYNKVDKALKSVGISIKDATGQFRNMDDVLLELSGKWKGLDRNSQRYIATIAAGSRQQSRFIALMENYERTMELVNVAQNSAGRSSQQFAKYQDTVEYRLNKISNTWEQFKTNLLTSDFYKDVLDNFNGFLNKLNDMSAAGLATLAGTWLTVGRRAISGTVNAASDLTGRIFTGKRAEKKFRSNSELTGEAQDEAWEKAKAEGAIKGQAIGTILSTSITSAITAGLTANDTTSAMGLSFAGSLIPNLMAGFQAAGPKGLLIGLGASIGTAVVSGIISSIRSKIEDEFKKTIEGQLKIVKKQVEKANEDLEKATSEAKSTESNLKDLEEIEKEYNELKNKIILTEDEQKKYNDLVNNLKENYPSLISYYDEETGKIKINNQLLEDRKKTLTELQKQQNTEVFATSITASEASTKETELTQKKKYLEDLSAAAGLSSSETTDLSKQIASYAGGSTDQLEKSIISMSDVNEQKLEEVRKILEDFKADYDNNSDKSKNEIFQQALENIKNNNPDISDTEARQRALKVQKKITNEEEFKNSDEYNKMLDFFAEARSGYGTVDLINWYTLDEDVRKTMSEFGYDKETYDKNLEGEKDLVKALDKVRYIGDTASGPNYTTKRSEIREQLNNNPDLLKDIFETSGGKDVYNKAKQKWSKKILEEGTVEEQPVDEQKLAEEIEKLKKNQNKYTIEEFNKKIEELSQGLEEGDKKKLLAGLPLKELENYQALLEEFGLKNDKTFQGLSSGVMEYSSQILQSLKDTFGADSNVGEIYKGFVESIQKFNLPKDLTNRLLSFNPKDLDGQTKEDAKESLMTLFNDAVNSGQITKEAAKKTAEQYLDNLEKSGLGNFSITNASAIDSFIEKAKKKYQDTVTNYKSAIDTINSNISNGFIDYLDKDKIEEAIKSLDLDPSKYLFTDEKGNYQIDVDKLNEDVQNQLIDENKITEELQEQVKEGINQLTQKKSIINSIISQYKAEQNITKELALQRAIQSEPLDSKKTFNDIAQDFAQTWDGVTATFTQKSIEEMEAEIKAIDTQIEELKKKASDPEAIEALKKERLAAANAIKSIYKTNTKAVEDFKKSNDDAYKDWVDKSEAVIDAQKSLAKAIETVTEKQKELANVIKGTDWKSNLDGMYNYNTALDSLVKQTERAKKELDKSITEDKAKRNAQIYGQSLLDQKANIGAQRQVYEQAIANYNKTYREKLGPELNTWEKQAKTKFDPNKYVDFNNVTKRYDISIDKLQKDELPKEAKSWVKQYIETVNEYQGKVEDLRDKEEELDEQYLEWKKQVRDDYIDLQQKMMDVLREKYQKEIDDLQNKYNAMEEADSKYLEALQKNIDKQRKLRDQENSWNELTDKERKLSLMQRDTSRGNVVEVKSLEKEVESDRTQLLDNAVDDIIEKLQEFYDLQKENRDAEIEYKQTLLDDVHLLKEVTETLKNIHTSQDLINWWQDNVSGIASMSKEEIQREKENWGKLITAKVNYSASVDDTVTKSIQTSEGKLKEVAKATQQVVTTTSEQITTLADTTLKEAGEEYKKAIKAAKDALQDAVDAVDKQKKALQAAIEAAEAAKKAFDDIHAKYLESLSTPPKTETKTVYMVDGKAYDNLQQAQRVAAQNAQHKSGSTTVSQQTVPQNTTTQSNTVPSATNTFNNNWTPTKTVKLDYYTSNSGTTYTKEQYKNIPEQAGIKGNLKQIEIQTPIGVDHGIIKYNEKTKKWELYKKSQDKNVAEKEIGYLAVDSQGRIDELERKKYLAFAQGGLVDYTGPAWVDGSRSRPEAFLSAEDTRRIGEAARILADLPILSQPVNKDTITNNTVGDTNIQIEVNVDQIANDYDVDEAVNRVEQKIVEAAKYAGSNVILKKR